MPENELKQKVEELIAENKVLLFMKGTPESPQCGFSMRVVQTLDALNVEYGAVDVLPALEPLREATGEISDWRTFPQLYVNGDLLGGAAKSSIGAAVKVACDLIKADWPTAAHEPHPSPKSQSPDAHPAAKPISYPQQ